MRLVYIILSHHLPDQLVRLVDRLDRPGVTFLIHLDQKMPDDDVHTVDEGVGGRPNVEFLPRHRCTWAAFSIVEATLEGVRRCRSLDFDYAILLSGQDYPIKSNEAIDAHFRQLDGKSIIHHLPFPMPDWDNGGWDRIETYHAHDRGRAVRFAARVRRRIPVRRKYPRGLHPYGGAQFWALAQPAIGYVLDFVAQNPRFVASYKFTFVPDEMFFQSIVGNASDAIDTVNDAVNFVEWDRLGAVLISSDFGSLADASHLYARKFDVRVDASVLDMIDRELLLRP